MTYKQQGWIPPQQPQEPRQRQTRMQRNQQQAQQATQQHQAQYAQPQYQQYQQPQTQYAQPQQYQAQYQQPQYQQYQQPQAQHAQAQHAQPRHQQPQPTTQERPAKAGGFLKNRNMLLLVSAVIAFVWFIVVCSSLSAALNATPTGDELEQAAYEIGTGIGFLLQLPFLVVAFIGTVFNWLGWLLNKKGFALTAGILFSVCLVLGFGNALGYIPCVVLAFVGYAKMKKK